MGAVSDRDLRLSRLQAAPTLRVAQAVVPTPSSARRTAGPDPFGVRPLVLHMHPSAIPPVQLFGIDNPRHYDLWSIGKDGENGTDDDICDWASDYP